MLAQVDNIRLFRTTTPVATIAALVRTVLLVPQVAHTLQQIVQQAHMLTIQHHVLHAALASMATKPGNLLNPLPVQIAAPASTAS